MLSTLSALALIQSANSAFIILLANAKLMLFLAEKSLKAASINCLTKLCEAIEVLDVLPGKNLIIWIDMDLLKD